MNDLDFTPLIWLGIAIAAVPLFALGVLVGWWLS